ERLLRLVAHHRQRDAGDEVHRVDLVGHVEHGGDDVAQRPHGGDRRVRQSAEPPRGDRPAFFGIPERRQCGRGYSVAGFDVDRPPIVEFRKLLQ
ncbi:hypothetical protein DF186_14995, partial [Enterococcus hirae]